MNRANYTVVSEHDDMIIIRDDGPWDQHPTVTNDAEQVVADLAPRLQGRRLLYIDSDQQMDEMVVKDGKFVGFRPVPR